MAAVKNGREYLSHVTETLKHRIAQLDESIEVGQKEIEGMHEYYWENYTEMDQYGYENFDNQQALLHEINASNEKIELRRRFRKMMDSPFSEGWISAMKEKMSRRYFISELRTWLRRTADFR